MAAQLLLSTCPECGAELAPGRACLDYFHDLLALEARVPGAPGAEPHFLAVAAYNLQHPAAFVPAVLAGLRRTVEDVLAGRATVGDARRRARRATDGPTRWAMTVRDVNGVAPEDYVARVRAWARAVTADLAAVPPLAEANERAG